MGSKYYPTNLFLEPYNYNVWFENEESDDTKKGGEEDLADTTKGGEEESADLPSMPPLERDKEVKEKGLKILTPNKLLTRLPVLLVQIKPGNSS